VLTQFGYYLSIIPVLLFDWSK